MSNYLEAQIPVQLQVQSDMIYSTQHHYLNASGKWIGPIFAINIQKGHHMLTLPKNLVTKITT